MRDHGLSLRHADKARAHSFVLLLTVVAGAAFPAILRAQSNFDAQASLDRELRQLRSAAQGFAAQLRPSGSFLGVRLLDIDADRAKTLKLPEERGVEVAGVEEGSPADSAGIRKGDVLLSYNGEKILGAQQFVRLVQETPQGRKVQIQVSRDGRTQTTVVTTGSPRLRFEMPPNFVGFTLPDVNALTMPDVPSPMLVWTNSLLGIECESVDSQLAQYFGVKRGVLVRAVEKGSAADKGGMRAGDVLVAVGERPVTTPHDVSSYLRSEHPAGKSISFSVVRDHKAVKVNVVAGENQQ